MIAAFAPLLLAASIRSKPCDAVLVPRGGITIDDGPGQCEEYARRHIDARTDVVVYAFQEIDYVPYQDFAHRVFITVHCNVSRVVYEVRVGQFVPTGSITARDLEKQRQYLRPLRRFQSRIIPCCAGCPYEG